MAGMILHILSGDSRSRAEQAAAVFAIGHHAEVYSDAAELVHRAPSQGIIVVEDSGSGSHELLAELENGGITLPAVVTAAEIELDRVVTAMRAGALDYLELPLLETTLRRRLPDLAARAEQHARRRRREVAAQYGVRKLSTREREVLALISSGHMNKDIAEQLGISARTVEIHRSNMMKKMGADHVAEVVRAWIVSGLETAAFAPNAKNAVPGTIGEDANGKLEWTRRA